MEKKYSVRVFRNIFYAPLGFPQIDRNKHLLDIYVPWCTRSSPCSNRFPVILYLHSGGWVSGDRSDPKPVVLAKQFAAQGYVVCVASYRLTEMSRNSIGMWGSVLGIIILMLMLAKRDQEKKLWLLIGVLILLIFLYIELQLGCNVICYPCQSIDNALALRWIYDHISDYLGDRQNLFLMGHSAGGHLATILAARPDFLAHQGLHQSDIRAVIGISGVYSDVRLKDSTLGTQLGYAVFGEDMSKWADAFPINHIHPSQPPVLLMNGEYEYGLKSHAYDYYKQLKKKGVEVEQISFKNLNHFNIVCVDMFPRVFQYSLSFLQKYIR